MRVAECTRHPTSVEITRPKLQLEDSQNKSAHMVRIDHILLPSTYPDRSPTDPGSSMFSNCSFSTWPDNRVGFDWIGSKATWPWFLSLWLAQLDNLPERLFFDCLKFHNKMTLCWSEDVLYQTQIWEGQLGSKTSWRSCQMGGWKKPKTPFGWSSRSTELQNVKNLSKQKRCFILTSFNQAFWRVSRTQ